MFNLYLFLLVLGTFRSCSKFTRGDNNTHFGPLVNVISFHVFPQCRLDPYEDNHTST